MWTKPDAELIEQGIRELCHLGLVDDAVGGRDAATSCGCRRRIPCTTSTTRRNVTTLRKWLDAEHAQRVPVRSQRHAQVQQPGPLDVHRDALGREHPRRANTTCGRSTSRPSTTSRRRRRHEERRRVATPRCSRAARSTPPRPLGPRSRRRMPPAGEPALAGTDATTRPDAPDARALRPHYPCLEGLRTIGVMALFFQHTGFTTGLQSRPGFSWMGHLELGPAMFFVLSAFLLYQPFVTANFAEPRPRSAGALPQGPRVPRDPGLLGHAHDPHHLLPRRSRRTRSRAASRSTAGRTASPSSSSRRCTSRSGSSTASRRRTRSNAEVIFYLLLPVYALLDAALVPRLLARPEAAARAVRARGGRGRRASRGARCSSGTSRRCARAASTTRHARLACAATQWFPGYADYFALGMAVALIASWRLVRGEEPRWLQRIGAAPDLLWLVALVLFIVLQHAARHARPRVRAAGPGRAAALLQRRDRAAASCCPGVFGDQDRGGVRRFLRWRPIAYTGLVSYGVYLWHQGFTDKAMTWTQQHAAARQLRARHEPRGRVQRRRPRRSRGTGSNGRSTGGVTSRCGGGSDRCATQGREPTASRTVDGRFPCFDGLRAIAALIVVFHHAAFTTAFELRGVRIPFTHHVVLIGHYFARMDAGVQVFFLISGFLLYRPMVAAAFAGGHPRDVRSYYAAPLPAHLSRRTGSRS